LDHIHDVARAPPSFIGGHEDRRYPILRLALVVHDVFGQVAERRVETVDVVELSVGGCLVRDTILGRVADEPQEIALLRAVRCVEDLTRALLQVDSLRYGFMKLVVDHTYVLLAGLQHLGSDRLLHDSLPTISPCSRATASYRATPSSSAAVGSMANMVMTGFNSGSPMAYS